MPGHPTDDPTPRSDQEADAPNQNSILRPESTTETVDSLAKDWQQQREEFEALLEKLKETVTESETSEPVLAEDLYETYREAQRERVSERLEQTSQLLQRGLDEPARTLADRAGEGIRQLRENIERSSESVLGSEQQSLHRAIRELDRARGALSPQGEPNENQQPAETEPSPADQTDPPRRSEPSDGQQRDGQQRDGQQRSGEQRANQQRAGNGRPLGPWNPEPSLAPLLGEEYQEWNDSIREVEELVRDPELKAEASRIREAAREMRIEYKRHSNLPQWPMVERMITQPMDQLRSRIAQELLRKTAEKNQIVPLDRDPVPRQFQEALDRYFERLGSESAKP
jgi:hypothetical protein